MPTPEYENLISLVTSIFNRTLSNQRTDGMHTISRENTKRD